MHVSNTRASRVRVVIVQLQHPSALNMFEEIVSGSKGKQIVVFLDYDGTLSPIVQDPDCAFITDEVRHRCRRRRHIYFCDNNYITKFSPMIR